MRHEKVMYFCFYSISRILDTIMKKQWATNTGFTIVELIVVIVVIGILAGISVVAYNGIQRRSVATLLQNDLKNSTSVIDIQKARQGVYPTTIPSDVHPSQGVTLALTGTGGVYSGLNAIQSGVLFHSICDQLVAEGYGNGVSLGGQIGEYITDCGVYERDKLQVNGWATTPRLPSGSFTVPIQATTMSSWYGSSIPYDPWWPDRQTVSQNFANQLTSRYLAKGGTFPITSFWDNWGGTYGYQALPTPTLDPNASTYCVQARHDRYPDMVWHIDKDGKPTEGACV